jgi:hypothetical protein
LEGEKEKQQENVEEQKAWLWEGGRGRKVRENSNFS